MASNVPVVKQVAWIAVLPQTFVLLLIGWICYLCGANNPVYPAAATYFLLGYILRATVARNQRKGMEFVKRKNYAAAIPEFEASYKFFSENEWLDKYRYITLLNASAISYREMALCNIAFCYTQIGEGKIAATYYQQVLTLYPENGLALAGLNVLQSASK
jgi:tetratricopeptide (TPR) repeat protein